MVEFIVYLGGVMEVVNGMGRECRCVSDIINVFGMILMFQMVGNSTREKVFTFIECNL